MDDEHRIDLLMITVPLLCPFYSEVIEMCMLKGLPPLISTFDLRQDDICVGSSFQKRSS